MLHEIYLDAIKNREHETSVVSINLNKDIFERADELWTEYQPSPRECAIVGVDSSYNKRSFQGFHLCVIDAVSVNGHGNVVAKEYESRIKIIDQRQLVARSMEMETNVAAQAAKSSDLVLIDGSLISRFTIASGPAIKGAIDLTNLYPNIIFISKTSDSRELFDSMNSKVGDIYYFNHISNKSGYSQPHHLKRGGEGYGKRIAVVYARLNDYTPLIKLEFPYEVVQSEVERTIDRIVFGSVSGYPNVLKVAHHTALITDDDLERLVSIYGLKNEIGSREVLR